MCRKKKKMTTMKESYTKQMFIKDLKELIPICEEELNQRKQGVVGDGTIGQLESFIIPELKKLVEQTKTDTLPPREVRRLGSAEIVIFNGGWNHQVGSLMGDKIIDLADNYEKNLE